MFFAVDVVAHTILLPVYLRMLSRSQMSAVRWPIAPNLPVDAGFLVLERRRLMCGQLSTPDTLRDTILLILTALIHRLSGKGRCEQASS